MKELERYERQIAIPQIGIEGQKKLQEAKVLVVGAGGLGCPVLTYLMCTGVGDIKVIDEDIVSETNLNRQFFYSMKDIGQPKVMIATQHLKEQNPDVQICGEQIRVTRDNVRQLVRDVDVVVDCVDNIETRLIMNEACIEANVPLVEGGIQDFYGFVTVVDGQHACLECMGFQNQKRKGITPTIGATAGVIGSMQALECVKLILGELPIAHGKMLQYDGMLGTMESIDIHPSSHCRFHGTKGSTKGRKTQEHQDIMKYDVREITRFRSKELGPEQRSSCELVEDLGMKGDKYAQGGERQLTLIGSRGKEWIQAQKTGFCFRKCKENLCLEGSLESLHCGDKLQIGEAVLEITIDTKDCYPDLCSLHQQESQAVECLLKEELRYAKVITSGRVDITK